MALTESKPTILVVDDAPANLQLMSGLLQADYRVKAATSGEKGLKIALSSSATRPYPARYHDARNGWV